MGSNSCHVSCICCVFIHVLCTAQDMENISEEDGWEFVNLGDQQSFGIKTAGLEEKATACQMLVNSLIMKNGGCTSKCLYRS